MRLLTVSLFMGQVSCVYWGHCGQGAQEDEPEKPLEEQGRWGRGSQCVPCRLLVVPGSRGEGPPHPRAESKVCGLLVSLLFSRSVVSDAVTPRTAARPASLSITNSWSLLKLTSIELVMPSNHFILCLPLFTSLQSFPASVFSNESVLRISWPKYWSFSFTINPSNEYSGLISFRMGWLDLLAVQGTLKSLLQYHSSKASILWCSAFFLVQTLTSIHDYWKNHSFD